VKFKRGPEPDETWLSRVGGWLERSEDLLVAFTAAGGGGSTSYFFCQSADEIKRIVSEAPKGARLVAYERHSLTLRGTVDDAFIKSARDRIPQGRSFLLVSLMPADHFFGLQADKGDSHEELEEYLEELRGVSVAVGLDPDEESGADGYVLAYKDGLVGAY
jgi:hypothetical protein